MKLNIRLKSTAIISALALFLTGCQSTKIEEVNGNGALVLPIGFELENVNGKHSCGRIKLFFADDSESFTVKVTQAEDIFYTGIGIISNLKPGNYTVTDFACYARPGRVFGSNVPYLKFPADFDFEIKENQILISRNALVGTHKRHEKTDQTWFEIAITDEVDSEAMQNIAEMHLREQTVPAGWEVVKENDPVKSI